MEQIDEYELAKFVELRSNAGGTRFYGSHPKDYGPDYNGWFAKNKWRFYLSIDAIRKAKLPVRIDDLQGVCGIYFLFLGDSIQYVGQSKHIQYRVTQHLYSMRPIMAVADWFDSMSAIWVPRDFLNRVEAHYISTLKPPRNSIVKTPVNLAPAIQRVRRKRTKHDVYANYKYEPEKLARILDGESREAVFGESQP